MRLLRRSQLQNGDGAKRSARALRPTILTLLRSGDISALILGGWDLSLGMLVPGIAAPSLTRA